jgi:hypothetical protein
MQRAELAAATRAIANFTRLMMELLEKEGQLSDATSNQTRRQLASIAFFVD